jgi:hypothetical protein
MENLMKHAATVPPMTISSPEVLIKIVVSPPRKIARKIRTVPPMSPRIVPISILLKYLFQAYEKSIKTELYFSLNRDENKQFGCPPSEAKAAKSLWDLTCFRL